MTSASITFTASLKSQVSQVSQDMMLRTLTSLSRPETLAVSNAGAGQGDRDGL